jgi:2-polyprenyl-6-hydroxyphenyl methylase/3-demethylubiquinone-9 3-methyltransferase
VISEPDDAFDHGSAAGFFDYYERASRSERTLGRFTRIRDRAIALMREQGDVREAFDVLDVGCGAGAQSMLWAELGHRVSALDVNGPLVQVGRQRAAERGLEVRFEVGTATALPYPDASFDVCLMPELLEHVANWKACVQEAVRVLRPRGLLYLSTTNALCPRQSEFDLPGYSWYPGFVKRRYERLAVTTRPELVSHATYPAVHWFTPYGLKDYLGRFGLHAFDRFDVMDLRGRSALQRIAIGACRKSRLVRFLAYVATEGTTLFALKPNGRGA